MDHFSGLPMFQKMRTTTVKEVIFQLKNWFSTFGVARLIRADRGPPFGSAELKRFCDNYCIWLNLSAPTTQRAWERQRGG